MSRIRNLLISLLEYFDLAAVVIVGILSIVVMVRDTLGIPMDAIPWFNQSNVTLALLAAIAVYMIRDRWKYFEKGQKSLERSQSDLLQKQDRLEKMMSSLQLDTQSGVQRILTAVRAAEIRQFKDERECLEYAGHRIRDPHTRTVDDTSWSRSEREDSDMKPQLQSKERFQEDIARALQKNEQLFYREIFLFNTEGKLKKLKCRELAQQQEPGYRCSYYKTEPDMPLLQFMIINKEEVIFMTDRHPIFFAIKSEKVADLFNRFFQDHWKKATSIRSGPSFPPGLVDQIIEDSRKNL